MKYSELIDFSPIESIVQLRDSDAKDKAKELVKSYVISHDMAERLKDVLFPNLVLDGAQDPMGMLVVGNYGSGKSHLMSVISAIAEDASVLDEVENPVVKTSAEPIAGKFMVARMEIGSTTMPLREIITGNISKHLAKMGVEFSFPEAHEVSENKTSFEDMMARFHQVYPDRGLLVAVDELLDYLRSRNQQDLVLDLGFLREIGEVCKGLKFRFIAGVQEAIFDSGRFAFAASSISRVKDRFRQIHIATSDVKFVVAHRLLRKTLVQKKEIRTYLEKFSKFYGDWNERMDDLVDLFPVHPDYIETFQKVPIIEKRGVLQVLSRTISGMAKDEVPQDEPGLLSFDGFWEYIEGNPAFRADLDVKEVMDCSRVVKDKVNSSFPKKHYRPLAIRILDGISVHRLTTNDIHVPIGLTPEELRDRLCLFNQMAAGLGGNPADDLLGIIDVTLREIRTAVSGQFISQNTDNRQVYLDLKKTDDYDALVEKKAATLSDDSLDGAYYQAMTQILECTDPSSFSGFRIWERPIPWKERNVTKLGWLFFGVPSERSTAQPPRDFYLYFIQPFSPPKFTDERKSDEVFFRLDHHGEGFSQPLKMYAAALDLESTSTGQKKQAYAEKAGVYFRKLTKWLRENFLSAVKVGYQGSNKALSTALAGANAGGLTAKEQIFLAASRQLTGHFATICGDYPTFSRTITFGHDGNATTAVQDALKGLSSPPTQLGTAVLDGLGLMNGEKIDPSASPYAKFIMDLLNQKGHGQVMNRCEIVKEIDGVTYFDAPGKFRLETELLVVVLGTLIHAGEIVLSIPGKEFAATDLKDFGARPLVELEGFKHIKKPKDWNLPAIKSVFDLLGLPSGLAIQVTQNDSEPLQQLAVEVSKRLDRLVMSKQEFASGLPFWGHQLLTADEITRLATDVDSAKEFLESLQNYKTPGTFKNFRYSAEEIKALEPAFNSLRTVGELKTFADALTQFTSYLTTAESILPEAHPWREKCQEAKKKLREEVLNSANRESETFRKKTIQSLEKLKSEYITAYLDLYRHARLDQQQDKQKGILLTDYRLEHLKQLASIQSINRSQLIEIQDEFGRLKTGQNLSPSDLIATPTAGEFFPAMEKSGDISADQRLKNLKAKMESVHEAWTTALLNDLDDPVTKEHLDLLKPAERKLVDDFKKEKELPDPLPPKLIPALQQALSGLSRVPVSSKKLFEALFPNGTPATLEEIKERFAAFSDELVRGQDRSKVRLVLENEEKK